MWVVVTVWVVWCCRVVEGTWLVGALLAGLWRLQSGQERLRLTGTQQYLV